MLDVQDAFYKASEKWVGLDRGHCKDHPRGISEYLKIGEEEEEAPEILEYQENIERDAEFAQEMGRESMEFFVRKEYQDALYCAKRAADLELQYTDKSLWMDFYRTMLKFVNESRGFK